MLKKIIPILICALIPSTSQAVEPRQATPNMAKQKQAKQKKAKQSKKLTHAQILERIFDLIQLQAQDVYGDSITLDWFLKNLGQPDKEVERPEYNKNNKYNFTLHYGENSPDIEDYGDFTIERVRFDSVNYLIINFNLHQEDFTMPTPAMQEENILQIAKRRGLKATQKRDSVRLDTWVEIEQDAVINQGRKTIKTDIDTNGKYVYIYRKNIGYVVRMLIDYE